MQKIILLFVLIFTFSGAVSAKVTSISSDLFAKGTEFYNVKLSPKGTYLSAKSKVDGKDVLIVLERATMKMTNVIRFDKNQQVGDYDWVNEERVVTQITYLMGWDEQPRYYGELFAVNADGSKPKYLMGYQSSSQQVRSLIKKKNDSILGTSYLLDPLVNDNKYMLATVRPWNTNVESHVRVYRVNVYTGDRKKLTTAPVRAANYLTDADGEVRFAISTANAEISAPHYRKKGESDWLPLKAELEDYWDAFPVAFGNDGNEVFLSASYRGNPKGLYKFNLKTSEIETVSKDEDGSFSTIWMSRKAREVYAVEYEVGYPTYEFVNSQNKLAKRLKSFLGALPGHQVRISDSTVDDSIQVVWAGNDRNPGDYYLFDEAKNKLSYLFSQKKWLDPNDMAETKPIKYNARDGLTIHGYLTMPKDLGDKKAPLIVMPHGGPHGPRDWWSFDSDVQLLASRGYAVLRVNFRGSGGYGNNFYAEGYRKWGKEIQFDILDGVEHVLQTESLDNENICIMGGSFGGYSALQSSTLAPDLFKCAVGVVGVYDLSLMYTKGDIQRRDSGVAYLKRAIGQDEQQLNEFSPVKNVAKLKAPVLIVHGEEDQRVPIEHAYRLMAAMKEHNKEYEYMEFDTEGHGFYKPEHRLQYYNKVLEFLAKHIKK